jgi:hypothetical protein
MCHKWQVDFILSPNTRDFLDIFLSVLKSTYHLWRGLKQMLNEPKVRVGFDGKASFQPALKMQQSYSEAI